MIRQRGQSLVFATIILMVVGIVLLLLFNTAQLTRSKMELQNTADATAYSIATMAARDYNFSAYMNRAMVANQVAVSQMVGLASWFRFTGQTIDNITVLCEPIPGLDAVCDALDAAYNTFEGVFVGSVLPVAIEVLNYWMTALSDLEQVFHYGNVEAIAQNLFYGGSTVQTGVLSLNDPDAKLVAWPDSGGDIPAELYRLAILIKDASDWWKFTSYYNATAPEMDRFAAVTKASNDGFAQSRSWQLFQGPVFDTNWILDHLPSWMRDIINDLLPVKIEAQIYLNIFRRGGTELKQVNKQYSWSAVDTMRGYGAVDVKVEIICGIHFCHWHGIPYPCGWDYCNINPFGNPSITIPLGWGAAYSQAPKDSTPGETIFNDGPGSLYGGTRDDSTEMFEMAVGEYGEEPLSSFGGLQSYYDISKPSDAASQVHDGPQLTIVVSKDLAKIRTAAQAGYGAPAKGLGPFGLDNLRLEEPSDASALYAISKGKLHFALDKQYSNLFSPYWEATLADTTDQERQQAYMTLFGWKEFLPQAPAPDANPAGLSSYGP